MADIIVRAPFATPDDPTPAIVLPIMNMADDCAAPQRAEPATKTKKNDRKVH
jgi:hypothetical protein